MHDPSNDDGKKATDDLQEIRILIDNPEASIIIGKGGMNVKRIRSESNAFISILKTEHQGAKERVMTIKGTVEHNTVALRSICQLLIDAATERNAQNGDNTPAEQVTFKILIHKFLAGAIIGKGGEIIKNLQTETGARVQISNDVLPMSSEKTVNITGSPDVIYAVSLRILSQLSNNPLRPGSSTQLYVPGGSLPVPTDPYGAYGAPTQFGAGYGGPPNSYGQQPYNGYGAPAGASPYGAPGGYGAAGPTKTEKIVIPTVCCGTVIGKSGSIISDIKRQSGTAITIAKPEPTAPDDRIVSITGTIQGINSAIHMIRQRVESYTPPPQTGGLQ